MRKFQRWWLIAGAAVIVFALIVVLFARDAQTPSTPVALPLTQTFSASASITFKYPDDWGYSIPTSGLLVVGPNQTLAGTELGPTLTIQRGDPMSVVGTLDDAINHFLQNGPLHTPGRWQVTDVVHTVQFQGQDARMVELEGADNDSMAPQHSQIIATSAKNTFLYLLITTVPVSKETVYDPTLKAILATIQILE